jgi:hypothetical protein
MKRLGCLALPFLLVVLYVVAIKWSFHSVEAHNKAFEHDLGLLEEALDHYARAHGGKYPSTGTVAKGLAAYLPGGQVPIDPFDSKRLLQIYSIAGCPYRLFRRERGQPTGNRASWSSASELAHGGSLPELRSMVDGPSRASGAVVYDYEPEHGIYVLYGVNEDSWGDSAGGPSRIPQLGYVNSNRGRL